MKNSRWAVRVIIFIMCFHLNMYVDTSFAADGFNDIENHWAENKIEKWKNEGRISGYPDGSFKPDGNISKAEFITLVNKLYGFNETDKSNYSDVDGEAWYANQTGIAKSNRYMEWYQENQLKPDEAISREVVSVIVAEILASRSTNPDDILNSFEDASTIGDNFKSQVASLVEKGFLNGYPDGSYKPQGAITRAEVLTLLDNVLGRTLTESGSIGNSSELEVIDGNITVFKGNTTLQNVRIKGDLLITAEVGAGDIKLENVTVDGRIIIDGGDSQVLLNKSNVSEMLILRRSGKSQIVSENSTVKKVVSKSDLLLEGDFNNSNVEIQSSGHTVELNGTFESVAVIAPSTIEIQGKTNLESLMVYVGAKGSIINTLSGTSINKVTFDGPAEIMGRAMIDKVVLNTDGVIIEPVVGIVEKKESTTDTTGVMTSESSTESTADRTPSDRTPSDTSAPSGYGVSIDQDKISASTEATLSFTFISAEVGTTYNYSIDDTNGGTSAITGSGTIATATDQIVSPDLSGLDDDTLTLTVYLTDSNGNKGNNVTDTIEKDTVVPSGYSVSIDSDYITSTNETAISFTFASAEVGTNYNYSIDDTNGGTPAVTGSGTIATATDQIIGIDVSGLIDDPLTLTVYLTDGSGNQGGNATDTVTKYTVVPSGYIVSIDQSAIRSSNDWAMSFTFVSAEVGMTYNFSIDDTSGTTSAVTGSGTITTATDQISGIDVSGLEDGVLNLSVTLSDAIGNVGVEAIDGVMKDATEPSGYSVDFDQIAVVASNETIISFTFTSAEVGTTYNYSIDDTNSGTSAIIGSGTIATATDQVSAPDLSGLDDDTLTLTVYLTDTSGNQGNNTTDTIEKDTVSPSGYSVSIDSSSINGLNETAMSFTFASAEVGSNYNYSIDDTNGGTPAVTGSGTIATATDQITGIDVSGLIDDTLTLTVYLTDGFGNQGDNVTDIVTKDTVAPSGYSMSIDQGAINSINDTVMSFTFASAEVGTTYNFSIDDTNGTTSAVIGSGTIATATDQISGIDVSGLEDGVLSLIVTLSDAIGNVGAEVTEGVMKDVTEPSGYSVEFDQIAVVASNETIISFTFTSAEVGTTYNYSIDDTNGGTSAITGSGTIATSTDQIGSLNLSGLDDDTLTVTVYLTDSSGNQGNNTTDTIEKDTVSPSGYSVSIDSSSINGLNETAMSFTFASAEVGSNYNYSIDDTNGGTPAVTGSGTITTLTDQITGIDVSGLIDDTLTLTVYLTDGCENQGGNQTDTVTKEYAPGTLTVSVMGPGTPYFENGDYSIVSSLINGKPQYHFLNSNENINYTIYWDNSKWVLIEEFDTENLFYNNTPSGIPPTDGWIANNLYYIVETMSISY